MTTNAFIGGLTIAVATEASPASYDSVTEAFSMSGVGAQNDLVDATHFGSAGSREYIGGLADGTEFTLACNYVANDTVQERLISDVANKRTVNWKVTVTSSSPNVVYTFAAAALGWEFGPAVDDRNTINFTCKISGAITVA